MSRLKVRREDVRVQSANNFFHSFPCAYDDPGSQRSLMQVTQLRRWLVVSFAKPSYRHCGFGLAIFAQEGWIAEDAIKRAFHVRAQSQRLLIVIVLIFLLKDAKPLIILQKTNAGLPTWLCFCSDEILQLYEDARCGDYGYSRLTRGTLEKLSSQCCGCFVTIL